MKQFLVAISFFTRIPIRLKDVSEESFFKSMLLMPLVGIIIGLVIWFVAWLSYFIDVPQVCGVLIVLTYIWFTGGLHLDGVADAGDALFSARDRGRMFEIMKDSRLGTYGAVSLFLLLLTDYACSQWFITHYTFALILMPVVGRCCALQLGAYSEAAPEGGGLGKGLVAVSKPWIPILYDIILLSLTWALFDRIVITAEIIALGCGFLLVHYFHKKLGGINGDCVGATIEITQAVFMVSLAIYSQIYWNYFFTV